MIVISTLVVTVATGLWWLSQFGWNVGDALESVFQGAQRVVTPLEDGRLFNPSGGFTLDQARERYRDSLRALSQGNYVAARDGFHELTPVFPGLRPWMFLHEAQALGALGSEAPAQERLKELLARYPDSPLQAPALYALGQSRLRARQDEAARDAFEKTLRRYPKSEYGVASLYYLGDLAGRDAPQGGDSLTFWRRYMDESPDGRFAYEIASAMRAAVKTPDPSDCRRMALGFATQTPFPKEALPLFDCARAQDVWLTKARALESLGDRAQAIRSAAQGLSWARNADMFAEGVDLIERLSSSGEAASALARIRQQLRDAQATPPGSDYLLWKLSQLDEAHAPAYWQELLTTYPQGDYAPQSSWHLLWRLAASGQTQAYLTQSDRHLVLYPYSQSAAPALFWRAKLLERKGARLDAQTAYERLLRTYPASYYAFRAYGRLTALKEGRPDPLWRTQPRRALPTAPPIGDGAPLTSLAEAQRPAAKALLEIGACDDLALLLAAEDASSPGTLSRERQVIESACRLRAGDRAGGIRALRERLDELARAGDLSAFHPRASEMKMLYPLVFTDLLQKESAQNGLDPFLALSLMREESYFNEMAVSSSRALGLMQLMPATANEVAGWLAIPGFQPMTLFQPPVNIRLGCRYLGHLRQTFSQQEMPAVGAYNGGPNAMKRWIHASPVFTRDPDQFVEEIPYEQTRTYIKKVFAAYWNYLRLYPQS